MHVSIRNDVGATLVALTRDIIVRKLACSLHVSGNTKYPGDREVTSTHLSIVIVCNQLFTKIYLTILYSGVGLAPLAGVRC